MKNTKTSGFTFIALLVLLFLLPLFSTTLYLPSIKSIESSLQATPKEIQNTIIIYFLIFSVAQLFYGPLSDRFGRKPVLAYSLALYTIATFLCVFTTTIDILTLLRSLQALSLGCSGLVFALLQDSYEGAKVTRIIASMSIFAALARMLSPFIGSYIDTSLSWHSNFILLGILGFILCTGYLFLFREASKYKKTDSFQFIKSYKTTLLNKTYLKNAFSSSFAFGALYSYTSGVPFILSNIHDYCSEYYGCILSLSALGYLLGSIFNGKLLTQFGMERLLQFGIRIFFLGSILMLVLTSCIEPHTFSVLIPQLLCEFGISIIIPITTSKAIQQIPQHAGTGSSFIGFLRFLFAGYGSYLAGYFQGAFALSLIVLSFAFLCLLNNERIAKEAVEQDYE